MRNILRPLAIAAALLTPVSFAASPSVTSSPLAANESNMAQLPAGWAIKLATPSAAIEKTAATTPALAHPNYDPGTIALCNAGFGDTVVNTYASKKNGTIDLKCGDSKSGYVHIRTNHEKASSGKTGYQTYVNRSGYDGPWDDLLEDGLHFSLTAPTGGYPKSAGSNKSCYAAFVELTYEDEVEATWWNNTIISTNNKLVITSYPSDGSPDCGQA